MLFNSSKIATITFTLSLVLLTNISSEAHTSNKQITCNNGLITLTPYLPLYSPDDGTLDNNISITINDPHIPYISNNTLYGFSYDLRNNQNIYNLKTATFDTKWAYEYNFEGRNLIQLDLKKIDSYPDNNMFEIVLFRKAFKRCEKYIQVPAPYEPETECAEWSYIPEDIMYKSTLICY